MCNELRCNIQYYNLNYNVGAYVITSWRGRSLHSVHCGPLAEVHGATLETQIQLIVAMNIP
jgi:hypothetical protein